MGRYLARRIVFSLLSLFLLIGFGFFLVRQLPGNPFSQDETLDPAVIAQMNQQMGFDKPLLSQYLGYLEDLFKGNLGISIQSSSLKVVDLIVQAFHWTLVLGGWSLLISLLVSLTLGLLLGRTDRLRRWVNGASLVAFCLPAPVAAPLFVAVFSLSLGWFPISRVDSWMGWILPILIVSIRPVFKLTRVLVTEMERVLNSEAIRNFRALGYPESQIMRVWVLKESLVAYVSYLGIVTIDLLAGSLLVEVMFGIPGLGYRLGDAISARDYLVLSGIIMVAGVLVLVVQLLVDVLICWLDPRVRSDVLFESERS